MRLEGLELIPSHAFVDRLIDLSTPFINDNIKRCGHPESETEPIPDPRPIEEPIATIPIAQTSQKLVNIPTAIGPGAIAQPIFKTDTAQTAIATVYLLPDKIEYEYF
jgi:hypothetical protein